MNNGDDMTQVNGEIQVPAAPSTSRRLKSFVSHNIVSTVIGGILLVAILFLHSLPGRVVALESKVNTQTATLVDVKQGVADIGKKMDEGFNRLNGRVDQLMTQCK